MPTASHSAGFRRRRAAIAVLAGVVTMSSTISEKVHPAPSAPAVEERVAALLADMTLDEKVGQLAQRNADGGVVSDDLRDAIRAGRVGSVLNEVDVETVNELQRIAVEESRLGIPLLVGRDVIHGFRTVMPIPLGQAATWNPELVREGARVAALEAARSGVNWTFAPMIDISRDARWGRIAESFGEDPLLTGVLGAAMVEGFQGPDPTAPGSIAACAKHFAGYGASEAGRDYSTTNVPENELRNVYLRPFRAAVDAGVMSLMASFSDIDGIPATANEFLMREVLRDEWNFDGLVVSDWDSIRQLAIHGLTEDDRGSAREAATAGVDMEMAGTAYLDNLADLVGSGEIPVSKLDTMVANVLRTKMRLGLFDNAYTNPDALPPTANPDALATARRAAQQSVVLLKNPAAVLPIDRSTTSSLAVIGPLADAPYEQLGTWIFDGDPDISVTPLAAIRELLGESVELHYVRALENSRSRDTAAFADAVAAAEAADVVLLFLGEESILSGEAHSRADISLPGAQAELVRRVRQAGTPVVAVILAGRPLTLADIVDEVDAILYAWHPGTMGGPAIADLVFGVEVPSGKLPASFPCMVGQVPIYYNQKNTGKPPSPDTVVHIDEIDTHAPQTSFGMTAFHLDAGYEPLYVFGHGLSYTDFVYDQIGASAETIRVGDTIRISARLTNAGDVAAEEVVQLYVRDRVGSVTRPVRELKAFRRVRLAPGESTTVAFDLHDDDLAFYDRHMQWVVEPGEFQAWIGGSSAADLETRFRVVPAD